MSDNENLDYLYYEALLLDGDSNVIIPYILPATPEKFGSVRPDNSTVVIDDAGNLSVPIAGESNVGLVKPDNSTITIDSEGTISAAIASDLCINEIKYFAAPTDQAGLHLLDGSVLAGDGPYASYVAYMASKYASEVTQFYAWYLGSSSPIEGKNTVYTITSAPQAGDYVYIYNGTTYVPALELVDKRTTVQDGWYAYYDLGTPVLRYTTTIYDDYIKDSSKNVTGRIQQPCFCTEAEWQASISSYGSCPKFVYDSSANTLRLPRVSDIIQGTTDIFALGQMVEAGLPNIKGTFKFSGTDPNTVVASASGAFSRTTWKGAGDSHDCPRDKAGVTYTFNAHNSSGLYKDGYSKVQPQTAKFLTYIVLANKVKTQLEVDINKCMTILNDLSNQYKYDGHVVQKYKSIATSTAINSYAWNLSDYLPNDGRTYEVTFNLSVTSKSATIYVIGTVANPYISKQGCIWGMCQTSSTSTQANNQIKLPIDANRILFTQIAGAAASSSTLLEAVSYRRLGDGFMEV